ncbi:MAG: FYDLN acid domain-containing protein [Deltaproteobacteria bacterium]|nr:FYDLN acid domain-containing protein [Deltaproteobacteria bacterium]
MNHPKFGTKYTCFSCATKFYDMKKPDPRCPKCGSDPKDDPALKAVEKGQKKGSRDGAEAEEFDEEGNYEADMDELVNDEEAEADDEPAEAEEAGPEEE